MNKKLILIVFYVIITTITYAQKEADYCKIFADTLRGNIKIEYRLNDGKRVDILTITRAFEVDFVKKFYEGIAQALDYSLVTGRQPAILYILPGNNTDIKHLNSALLLIDNLNNHGYNIVVWTIDYNKVIKKVR